MGAFGRTKSKEPEKWKPVWQVPSKEVAKIFDSATKTREPEPEPEYQTNKDPQGRGFTNLAAGVAPEEKDLCYRSRYQGKKEPWWHLTPG